MNEREQLLRAILEQPDDDTVRLAFADCLDENGDHDRAEFIRLQIAAAAKGDGGTYWSLHGTAGKPTRFGDLVKNEPWGNAPSLEYVRSGKDAGYLQASSSSAAVLWRRGFIEGVLCSGVSLGPQLGRLREHPVREVLLTNEPHLSVCTRLHPGWEYGTLFRFGAERNQLAFKLLSGSGGFPKLLFAEFWWGGVPERLCPFRLVASATKAGAA